MENLLFIDDSIVIWTIIIERHSLALFWYRGHHRDGHVGRSRVRSTVYTLYMLLAIHRKEVAGFIACLYDMVRHSFPITTDSAIFLLKYGWNSCRNLSCAEKHFPNGRRKDRYRQATLRCCNEKLDETAKQNKVTELRKKKLYYNEPTHADFEVRTQKPSTWVLCQCAKHQIQVQETE